MKVNGSLIHWVVEGLVLNVDEGAGPLSTTIAVLKLELVEQPLLPTVVIEIPYTPLEA